MLGFLLCSAIVSIAQNYVVNPDLEAGSIPGGEGQLSFATGWMAKAGYCGAPGAGSPDLFDTRTSNCRIDIPANKWAFNTPVRASGNRYIGFSGPEEVFGSINPLPSGCGTYVLSFYVHAIDNYPDQFSSPCAPVNPAPHLNSKVEIRLTNSSNCASALIYSSPTITPSPSWQLLSTSFTLTSAQLAAGYNKIDIKIVAPTGYTYGQILFMDDFSITAPPLVPSLTGATSFCIGSPLTFNGSMLQGIAANHFWEIIESDASGNPVSGGYVWSSWYSGNPSGTYTFPALPLVCNKYYKVKLAVGNACIPWAETSHVIYLNCLPTANAGPDVTICNGGCTTIGVDPGFIKFTNYTWTSNAGIVGNSAQITVCPTTTTTYTLTVNNTKTGCSATDVVTVFVVNNPPDFTMASNLNPSDNFYTLFATPINMSALSIPGFGFAWFVDEIVSPTNTTVIAGSSVSNPSCWWSTLTCNYNGYDGPYFTATSLNPMAGGCSSPSVGRFTAGHTYRITRGTWSNDCPWQQYSVIVYMTHAMAGSGAIAVMEDTNAPDYSGQLSLTSVANVTAENSISVYPNPSNGVFSVELNKAAAGTIEVFDALGNSVQRIEIRENASDYKLDMSGYSKGIYMLNVISEGNKYSKKIILE